MTWIVSAVICIVVVEIVARLPVVRVVSGVFVVSNKAFRVLQSKAISDHWKEKVMLVYSKQILLGTITIAVAFIALGLIIAALIFAAKVFDILLMDFLESWLGIVFTCSVATAYYYLRKRFV